MSSGEQAPGTTSMPPRLPLPVHAAACARHTWSLIMLQNRKGPKQGPLRKVLSIDMPP